MTLKILTANRLLDGVSVWLGANGVWQEDIKNAFVARHQDAVQSLEDIGKKAVSDNFIVDVALIDVDEKDGELWPRRLRERIRLDGPSVAYGYQVTKSDQIAAA